MALCNTKSVGKGLKKLIDEGYLTKEPDDAVALLRLCGDRMPAREVRPCQILLLLLLHPVCSHDVVVNRLVISWVTLVVVRRKRSGTKMCGKVTWLVRCLFHASCLQNFESLPIDTCHFTGLDFTGMPFDVAFRYLLTNAGFFLPGEAQKIDRITQVHLFYFCG